ncbi:MAG: CCA tRNA nucleotidyltransferase [Cyanobacteriota bacterium]
MPTRPGPDAILTCDPGDRLRLLWQSLAPERWPVPPEAFPEGTVLVGGAVRDGLLGRLKERPDLDLVVPDDAISLGRSLQRRWGGSCVVLDPQRSIVRLVCAHWSLDLARREGADLETDLGRRDFTGTAIARPLPAGGGDLIDPLGGLGDLASRRLVAVSEANLLDDPLRLLRGLRLACELDFAIEEHTWGWIRRHHRSLEAVAGERVLAELERMATAPAGHRGLQRTLAAGLLAPSAAGSGATETALEALTPARAEAWGLSGEESTAALPLARLATVLDGETVARLRGSRRLQQRCDRLRWGWQRLEIAGGSLAALEEADRLSLQRNLEAELPALLLRLENREEAVEALQRWRDPGDRLFHPRPPIDGTQLQHALGRPPGPWLGRLLDHLTRESAFGRLADGADAGTEILTSAWQWLQDADPRHD